jgi:hypothetical protein
MTIDDASIADNTEDGYDDRCTLSGQWDRYYTTRSTAEQAAKSIIKELRS